ncbi:MAG: hypothetical protein LBQ41_03970 [Candidatus Ancillula sp.]|nr:hypothetical protein [Candidatus Ancillula sp.]
MKKNRVEFAKIMLENDLDESLQEVVAAEKMRDATPRVGDSNVDDAIDVGGWGTHGHSGSSGSSTSDDRRDTLKVVLCAVVATVVIIGLVALAL